MRLMALSHNHLFPVALLLLGIAASFNALAGVLRPGDIVFAEGGQDIVIRLDPKTGITNHIAAIDFTDANGGIVVGPNGDIYAMRSKLGFDPYAEFFRIDGQTAAVTPLSSQALIVTGRRMKLSPDGQSLVVAGESQSGRGVFRVDLSTGQQSVITTNLLDLPEYERPRDVAFSPQGHIYVLDFNFNNLLRFNADGTGRRLVSDGQLFAAISGVDVAPDGSIYIADRTYHGVIRVDPETGVQSPVTSNGFFRSPADLVVAPDGSLLVAEALADVIVRVAPATGQQTLLHSGTPGPRTPCVFFPPTVLEIRQAGDHIAVRWPDPTDAWQLQATGNLLIPTWTDSQLVPASAGDHRQVTAPLSNDPQFYRLRAR